jgi:glycosyltransferase involved in cell wall biosynthesis
MRGSENTPPIGGRHAGGAASDLVCFSHLRWNFVFQRPNHLMSRFARVRRVFFVEEPVYERSRDVPELAVEKPLRGLFVCVPRLPAAVAHEPEPVLRTLLLRTFSELGVSPLISWLYTPMALPLAEALDAPLLVYDCMDELSAFLGSHPELGARESALFARAHLVFTGGHSLWEAKRHRHPSVHAFPSSVDAAHFRRARSPLPEPSDQVRIPRPRAGFFGVVDERMDVALLRRLAEARPDLHIVMLGPVVKIHPSTLPRMPNIHWLGRKRYEELPRYVSGWDVALMPFAQNEATRFISPTKTLEYLAAGRPVVSTPIRDVERPYGDLGLVHIATADGFAEAVDRAMGEDRLLLAAAADEYLARTSWDATWSDMSALVDEALARRRLERPRGGSDLCSTT